MASAWDVGLCLSAVGLGLLGTAAGAFTCGHYVALAAGLGIFALLLLVAGLKIAARQSAAQSPVTQAIKAQYPDGITTVGFFHPYCNAGGGGERVLWCAINALHQDRSDVHCVVYTGDTDATGDAMIKLAKQRFGSDIDATRVSFVFLRKRGLVEASMYPSFTMLGQAAGSVALGYEALGSFVPDIFIDSMGYAFTLPMFKIMGGCRIGAYVHYPTISTDMLCRVANREAQFNNNNAVAKSWLKTQLKLVYYRLFATCYGWAGRYSDVVLTNSTWTHNHVVSLWKIPDRTQIVYPPCDTGNLEKIPLQPRRPYIVSVAQFRPEKNHRLQLDAFHALLQKYPEHKAAAKLVMVGGCRNDGDEARVASLRTAMATLGLTDKHVEFRLNVSFPDLQAALGEATIGLHTMKDEHFGIGVVEFLASGAVALAHDSAGPKMDIVVEHQGQPTGFLASTAEQYAEHMNTILTMSGPARHAIQANARAAVSTRFSEPEFAQQFVSATKRLFA